MDNTPIFGSMERLPAPVGSLLPLSMHVYDPPGAGFSVRYGLPAALAKRLEEELLRGRPARHLLPVPEFDLASLRATV